MGSFNPTQVNNQMSSGSNMMNPSSMGGGGTSNSGSGSNMMNPSSMVGGSGSGNSNSGASSPSNPKYDPNNVVNTGGSYDPNKANSAASAGVGTGGNAPSFTSGQGFKAQQQSPGSSSSPSSSSASSFGSSQTQSQPSNSQTSSQSSGQGSQQSSGSGGTFDPVKTNSMATAGFNPLNPLVGANMNQYMGPQSSE